MFSITYCWLGQDKKYTVIEDFKIPAKNEYEAIISLKEKLPHIKILEVHQV